MNKPGNKLHEFQATAAAARLAARKRLRAKLAVFRATERAVADICTRRRCIHINADADITPSV